MSGCGPRTTRFFASNWSISREVRARSLPMIAASSCWFLPSACQRAFRTRGRSGSGTLPCSGQCPPPRSGDPPACGATRESGGSNDPGNGKIVGLIPHCRRLQSWQAAKVRRFPDPARPSGCSVSNRKGNLEHPRFRTHAGFAHKVTDVPCRLLHGRLPLKCVVVRHATPPGISQVVVARIVHRRQAVAGSPPAFTLRAILRLR